MCAPTGALWFLPYRPGTPQSVMPEQGQSMWHVPAAGSRRPRSHIPADRNRGLRAGSASQRFVADPTVFSEVERTPGYLQCTVHCSRAWAAVHMLVLASHWRSTLPTAFPHLSHRRWGGLNRRCILSHNPGRHRA